MGHQIHKRLPKDFVVDVIKAFCEKEIEKDKACKLLDISKAQLYRLRKKYLTFLKEKKEFKLYNRERKVTHSFPKEVQDFLHKELDYIKYHAEKFKKKFNFSYLAESAQKRFNRPFYKKQYKKICLKIWLL